MNMDPFGDIDTDDVMSTINMTSLVDVSLVVLIIFILIAPIMEQGISLNLPKSTSGKVKSKEALTIEVNKKGQLFLDTLPVSYETFEARIKSIASYNKDQAILIRADQNNKYGDMIKIIDIIKRAGLHSIGLLTNPHNKKK